MRDFTSEEIKKTYLNIVNITRVPTSIHNSRI